MKIIWFTFDGIGLSIAHKLIEEGNEVIVAQVQSKTELGEKDDEEPETKRRRLSLYDGIIDKKPAQKVLAAMEKVKNKDELFVFFDFNNMWKISEKVLNMGYSRGFFPLKEDLEFENDREKAKQFVMDNYPDLKVAEVEEFTSAKDGIEFLNETEEIWVLKGNGDDAKTVVPQTDNPEQGCILLIDALEAHGKDYENGGFILERKIINALEITPQIVFNNGEVVYTDADIENKPIGAGNLSVQTGCMQNLIIATGIDEQINEMAFPPIIFEMAQKRKGIFVWDASMLYADGEYYFGEFCPQRFGWDAIFSEIAMSGSATEFFEAISEGINPLKHKLGVAVRGMNLHKDGEQRRVLEGITIDVKCPENTFIYECKQEDGTCVCTGGAWDLAVFTGAADTIEEAVDIAYEAAEGFTFEDLYYRPKLDFLSQEYISSIANRYSTFNGDLFEAPGIEIDPAVQMKNKVEKIKQSYEKEVSALREQVTEALNGEE